LKGKTVLTFTANKSRRVGKSKKTLCQLRVSPLEGDHLVKGHKLRGARKRKKTNSRLRQGPGRGERSPGRARPSLLQTLKGRGGRGSRSHRPAEGEIIKDRRHLGSTLYRAQKKGDIVTEKTKKSLEEYPATSGGHQYGSASLSEYAKGVGPKFALFPEGVGEKLALRKLERLVGGDGKEGEPSWGESASGES